MADTMRAERFYADTKTIAVESIPIPEPGPGMTVLDPDGAIDTWHLNQGDVYFIPRAYPHHIEVVAAPDLHFLIFFDRPIPGDIGYRTSISAYSREVLAATFNTHIDDLPDFPFTKADPLIVTRNNPLDR